MTPEQIQICLALGTKVTFLPGSWDKRMAGSLCGMARVGKGELTEKQNEWMYRLLYKYRRQIPSIYEKYKHVPECSKK